MFEFLQNVSTVQCKASADVTVSVRPELAAESLVLQHGGAGVQGHGISVLPADLEQKKLCMVGWGVSPSFSPFPLDFGFGTWV